MPDIERKVRQAMGYMSYLNILCDGWYFGVLVEVSLCACHQCLCVVGSNGRWQQKQWVSRGATGERVASVVVRRVFLCGMHFTDFHPARRSAENLFAGRVVAPGLAFPQLLQRG